MDPDQDLHRENRRLKALVDDLLLERDAHLNELDRLRGVAREIVEESEPGWIEGVCYFCRCDQYPESKCSACKLRDVLEPVDA